MALYMRKSKIVEGKRVVERVKMSTQEASDFLAEQAQNAIDITAADTARKRKKLIANALDIAARAAIAGQITAIDNMSDAALDAALAAEALS